MGRAQPDHERRSQQQLYTRYYGYALSICLRYARHREEALEVVNDGFMKLFRDISRFDPSRYELQSSFQVILLLRRQCYAAISLGSFFFHARPVSLLAMAGGVTK